MEIRVTRETVRSVRLEERHVRVGGEVAVRVRQPWGDAQFMPDLLVETGVEGDVVGTGARRYSITLKGRVLTGKGALHATRRAERTWTGETALKAFRGEQHEGRELREPEFPAALAHLLAGPAALSLALAEVERLGARA
jgi:hypothetical protein